MSDIVPAGQGHLLSARGNVLAFRAVAAQTGGGFFLMERTVPAGARMPPAWMLISRNCTGFGLLLSRPRPRWSGS